MERGEPLPEQKQQQKRKTQKSEHAAEAVKGVTDNSRTTANLESEGKRGTASTLFPFLITPAIRVTLV
jgi:hypothetical protein